MKNIIRNTFQSIGLDIRRSQPNPLERVVHLRPKGESRGNVLLSYILQPFLLNSGELISKSHTNLWESFQIAQTFLDLGYCVDAIDYRNMAFKPNEDYDFIVDVRHNLQRLAPQLNENCIKIFHIDLCHMLVNIANVTRRIIDLQQRRGITLPNQFEVPNMAIETADCATMLGNDFTEQSFAYARKKIYRIPISQPVLYDWPKNKDFDQNRKTFLWFGSSGFIRKGLDLVLEVFAKLPDYKLYVCGPIESEESFKQIYHKELYESKNIYTIGWVDIASEQFMEICRQCVGLIYPSSSEGQCGGVVTSMHASLIPVVSYETGVDVDESYGVMLPDCTLSSITDAVRRIGEMPAERLATMARNAWDYARRNHTKERFAQAYREAVLSIREEFAAKSGVTRHK